MCDYTVSYDAADPPINYWFVYQNRVNDFVRKLQYKPGWRLSLHANPDGFVTVLSIVAKLPDRETLQEKEFFTSRLLNPEIDIKIDGWEKKLLEAIRGRLLLLETHELDEFIKYDGVRIFDPHVKIPEALRARLDLQQLQQAIQEFGRPR